MLCLSFGLAACEGSAAGTACATTADIAHKITRLTDDLDGARSTGKIDATRAGEIAGEIMATGRTKGAHAYCNALDKVRRDYGL